MEKQKFYVFFSWQSDLPLNKTKKFIEDTVNEAKRIFVGDRDIILDEATRDRFGSPDITATVFEKIRNCDLFIADVSIVGRYEKNKPNRNTGDGIEEKFFPNPNVLVELGYAAGTIGWDHIILIMNDEFGIVDKLPFDLRQRRVTTYNTVNKSRKAEINRISKIFVNTVEQQVVQGTLPKPGFASYIVGAFDFKSSEVKPVIEPLDDLKQCFFDFVRKEYIEKARNLKNEIDNISFQDDTSQSKEVDNSTDASNLIVNDMVLKTINTKLIYNPIEIPEQDIIKKHTKKYLHCDLDKDFFNLGSLRENTFSVMSTSLGRKPSLVGSDLERNKYSSILEYKNVFFLLETLSEFERCFETVKIVPIAIQNISQETDEDIAISLHIEKGKAIRPTKEILPNGLHGKEGIIFEENWVEGLMYIPETAQISVEKRAQMGPIDMPTNPLFQNIPDEVDFERELSSFAEEPYGLFDDDYVLKFQTVKSKEMKWASKVLLIEPEEGNITISYNIISKKTTGDISGCIEFCE